MYARGAFHVIVVLVDQKFDKLESLLSIIESNTTAAWKYVEEIECKDQTVKDRSCSMVNVLPYSVLPKPVVIRQVTFVVLYLNA